MTRVLIAEDTPSHMDDALRIAAELGIEAVPHTYANKAWWDINRRNSQFGEPEQDQRLDGVITDIYIPHANDPRLNSPENPAGLAVAAKAHAHGLPLAICTAGYHHGARYEWIHAMCAALDWPLIEGADGHRPDGSYDREYEAPSKPWEQAFKFILQQIEERKNTKSS